MDIVGRNSTLFLHITKPRQKQMKNSNANYLARREGIEPPLTGPKPAVLPLDDLRKQKNV